MHRTIIIYFILSILLFQSLSEQIGTCGPVDYYYPKVLDSEMHLDSRHKDTNESFEYILGLLADLGKNSPEINGRPVRCTASVLDMQYNQSNGALTGSVCTDAIISCLKYYVYTGDTSFLKMAGKAGNFIIYQDLTPLNYISYPDFPYAVGSMGNIHPNVSGHPDSSSLLNPEVHFLHGKDVMMGVTRLQDH